MVEAGELANIATALAVIVAFALGLLQWRQFDRKRQEVAAYEVLHSIQSPEFIRATRTLIEMPEGLTAAQVQALGSKVMDDIFQVATIFEALGPVVQRRIVDITMVDDIYGGFIRMSWRKLRDYAEATRREMGNPTFMEWLQWLAERLEKLDRLEKKVGAHVAHRDWRP
ncbi:MAG TPA: hypothetical protein VGR28_08670 [Candidatus Thermoplasmatota archaeon]|nr:hypothetical protein [Candidatus Thermoplasmatota archaeon]